MERSQPTPCHHQVATAGAAGVAVAVGEGVTAAGGAGARLGRAWPERCRAYSRWVEVQPTMGWTANDHASLTTPVCAPLYRQAGRQAFR